MRIVFERLGDFAPHDLPLVDHSPEQLRCVLVEHGVSHQHAMKVRMTGEEFMQCSAEHLARLLDLDNDETATVCPSLDSHLRLM